MRLFLKIFLSFLLTVLLAGWTLFWSGHHLRALMDERQHDYFRNLLAERRHLAELLSTQEIETVRQTLSDSSMKDALRIFDNEANELLNRSLPDWARAIMEHDGQLFQPHQPPPARDLSGTAPSSRRGMNNRGAPDNILDGPPPHQPLNVTALDGKSYRLLILPPPPRWMTVLSHYPERVIGVFAGAGLVVFLLTRHFTTPIRRLRQMAKALANGDLTARAMTADRRIPDELSDLANEFNFMAGRLLEMFLAQQRLLSDVSHELRSPLARMRVAIGLLEQSPRQDTEDNLARLSTELERLDELIGQIITIARPETLGGIRRDVLVDLAALIKEVVSDGRFEMERTGGTLLIERLDPALLWADAGGLHSAIDNVLRNALHHSALRGKTVRISMIRLADDQVELTVIDQGPGVPEADIERIFAPFFRVQEARERASGGFGLGLAIAARAVREHGGTIAARNHPEGGLQVTITLPVEPALELG